MKTKLKYFSKIFSIVLLLLLSTTEVFARGGGGGSGAAKTYADLPREAQEACDRFAKRLVGPKGSGRAYETVEAYRKHYVEDFDWA